MLIVPFCLQTARLHSDSRHKKCLQRLDYKSPAALLARFLKQIGFWKPPLFYRILFGGRHGKSFVESDG